MQYGDNRVVVVNDNVREESLSKSNTCQSRGYRPQMNGLTLSTTSRKCGLETSVVTPSITNYECRLQTSDLTPSTIIGFANKDCGN